MGATLYAAMFMHSYILSIVCCGVQVRVCRSDGRVHAPFNALLWCTCGMVDYEHCPSTVVLCHRWSRCCTT